MKPRINIDPHNRIQKALAVIASCIIEPQLIDDRRVALVIRRAGGTS